MAKIYGQVLCDLGLLSKGEVILKVASDFVGSVIGQSEEKTKAILKAAKGHKKKRKITSRAWMRLRASWNE